jgi:DnaK suppressor protein
MDDQWARVLLRCERLRLQESLKLLGAEGTDPAVVAGIGQRLAAIDRAQQRLEAGTFGRSIRSGLPIPDERLEADPAAELTADESRQDVGDRS